MKLLKFGAPWCTSCKALSAMLEANPIMIGSEKLEIEEINIENDDDRVEQYKVRGIPACVLIGDKGEDVEIWRAKTPTIVSDIQASVNKYYDQKGI